MRLNVVDSSAWLAYFVHATARAVGATVWTQDDDFRDLPDVRYVPKRAAS